VKVSEVFEGVAYVIFIMTGVIVLGIFCVMLWLNYVAGAL